MYQVQKQKLKVSQKTGKIFNKNFIKFFFFRYVEEKNFINRTDQRQFEIERDLRLKQQEKKRFENQ